MAGFKLPAEQTARIQAQFGQGEGVAIVRILNEWAREANLASDDQEMENAVHRVLLGEPVQYVTGYCWFYHLRLEVNPDVLIPRPETEELVDWIIKDASSRDRNNMRILDIGTGSGCIALALKKQMPSAEVTAVDISEGALRTAQQNATANGLDVTFHQINILRQGSVGRFDVIVSNPPYVSEEEFNELSARVKKYEPRIALAPEDDDGLIFYRTLASYGPAQLTDRGRLFLELNEFRAHEIHAIFIENGFQTEMLRDMQGKWRMLKCLKFKV